MRFFHYVLMNVVLIGGIVLFVIAFMWFARGNVLMGVSMFIMGAIAESNYLLHLQWMKKMKKLL